MRFKKIKIKNIRSYKDEEIIFPEGSLLLSGEVGSGKTSILLAIEYALFGLQPGQKGSLLLRNDSKIGEVVLELEVSGETVIIERKLKRTPKGVTNEHSSIIINNERWESSVTEIKTKIFSLLGYPPEIVKKNNSLYRYTVYSPQEQMKQIILEDPETRLNLLRHIFGIDRYKRTKENLSILISALKTDSRILQAEISTLEKDKEEVSAKKEKVEKISKRISELEKNLIEKINERKKIEESLESLKLKVAERRKFHEEIEKTKILLASKKETLSSLLLQKKELLSFIKESFGLFKEVDYNLLVKDISTKKQKIESLLSLFAEITGKIRSLEQERINTLSKKERIFKMKICPTCLQDVSDFHKHNILNETETKLSEINKEKLFLESKIKKVTEELSKQKSDLQKIEEEKFRMEILKTKQEQAEKSKEKLAQIEKQIKITEEDISILTKHIEGLKEQIFEYAVFEQQEKKKAEELKIAFQNEKMVEINLAETKKELEFLKNEISIAENKIMSKEESKKRFYELTELIDWLSNKFSTLVDLIERNVLYKLRTEFSSLFRKWFSMLVQDNSLDSQIDEKFTPLILQGEVEMDYEFLSGGERTAIALAYRLALNQTINSIMSKIKTRGIIILDEPTDGFSETQIDKIRDILEELNAEQLIIVSHEQKIESFVDNVIRVFKEGNISRVEYAKENSLN